MPSRYLKRYVAETGKAAPKEAARLDSLFNRIAAGETLPPRGQQAVEAGLTAHSLNDAQENPAVYDYYQWVLAHCFTEQQVDEVPAKLIGMAFICANVFETDLPQPLTLNPWQITAMADFPLRHHRIIIVENNGVFAWLHRRHPEWPLIDQSGNDFNSAYVMLMRTLVKRGVHFTYLGDLDSRGIQIADHLLNELAIDPAEFTALQSPANVLKWVTLKGKSDSQRTRPVTVKAPVFQQELNSLTLVKKFVEQEQLITEYEELITAWLKLK
ncbi:DUF2399 domain-containing protein [Levilactobacillus koreensis]|uniref:DUF2399 domain-containing protein n=1 Tax=Levilactobacillus koreensis TaxID=637971 RepID=A0AAC8UV40_9LACO|nr:DUF2399 domain-containing protein [Levilactobacillus koreensis]AKP64448.1 hypothetical protein ABN16_05175 [Levilactobacillus koreensis]